MRHSMLLGSLVVVLLAFGCGGSKKKDAGVDGGVDGGVDAGVDGGKDAGVDAAATLNDFVEANDALVDAACDCLAGPSGFLPKAACIALLDALDEIAPPVPDAGFPGPELPEAFEIRALRPSEQECLTDLIDANEATLQPFFDCQAEAAGDAEDCYEATVLGPDAGPSDGGVACDLDAGSDCDDAFETAIGTCPSISEPLAEELEDCIGATPATFVEAFADVILEQCECSFDPEACRESSSISEGQKACLTIELEAALGSPDGGVDGGPIPEDALDCGLEWFDRAQICYDSTDDCDEESICGTILIIPFGVPIGPEICPPETEALLTSAAIECGIGF